MATHTINIPAEIKPDYQNVFLLNLAFITAIHKASKQDTILFDFSRTSWIDAEMTVLLSMMFELALLTSDNVTANIETMPEKVKTILQKNNFFPFYGLGPKMLDTFNTTITFFADTPSNDNNIHEYIREEVFAAIGTKSQMIFSRKFPTVYSRLSIMSVIIQGQTVFTFVVNITRNKESFD